MKWLFKLYFNLAGWKEDRSVGDEFRKSVIIVAPHTSNWDFLVGYGAFSLMGVAGNFAIKKELMFFPLNIFFGALGGIAIDRGPKNPDGERKSYVDALAELFEGRDELVLAMAPEGTRSLRKQWKTGFYWVALKAKVPITLGYIDYKTKMSGLGKMFYPTGDIDKDMREIMNFYKGKTPLNKELYSLDERYI